MFRPAWQQKCESIERYAEMTLRLADYYENTANPHQARQQLSLAKATIEIQKEDIIPPFWKSNIYEYSLKEILERINQRIAAL